MSPTIFVYSEKRNLSLPRGLNKVSSGCARLKVYRSCDSTRKEASREKHNVDL